MNDLKDIAEITLKHFGADLTCTEQYKRIEKKLAELEDLQAKETPKKLRLHPDDKLTCYCGNCDYRFNKRLIEPYKYCPNCGQRLTWEGKK